MDKGLYNIFNHWYRGGQIWLYSDPHFSDEDCYRLRCPKLFDDHTDPSSIVQDLDQMQLKNINSKVGKKDTIIILGDIGNIEWVRHIRGYKILIMGNHDAGISNYMKEDTLIQSAGFVCPNCGTPFNEDTIDFMEFIHQNGHMNAFCPKCYKYVEVKARSDRYTSNYLFDEVYEGPLVISPKIILSHEPVDCPWAMNIHGHVHDALRTVEDDHHINVCAELIGYTPVSLTQMLKSGAFKDIQSIHRITIDRATERCAQKAKSAVSKKGIKVKNKDAKND